MFKVSIITAWFLVLASCSKPILRLDAETFLRNPEKYNDENILITTDLENLMANYALYRNKKVMLSAPVSYYGYRGFWTWYIILEKNNQNLRCYEFKYRKHAGWDAQYLLALVKSKGGEISIRGTVLNDGIELDWLCYDGFVVNTNHIPRRAYYYSY